MTLEDLHEELDREAEDARVDRINDDAVDALEAEDELPNDYDDQREAMIDAERSAYYGDLGVT